MKILRSLLFIFVLAYFLQALMNDEAFRGQFEKNLEVLQIIPNGQGVGNYQIATEAEKKSRLRQGLVTADGETIGLVAGNDHSSTVLVEFFDFSCVYCKKIAPVVSAAIRQNPDIKIILEPMAIIGPFSEYAVRAFFAAVEQGKMLEMYDALLIDTNRLSRKSIDAAAQNIGLDMQQYFDDVKSRKFNDKMGKIMQLSREFQIKGVPVLFLNGERISGQSIENLQSAVDIAKTLPEEPKDSTVEAQDDALQLLNAMGHE